MKRHDLMPSRTLRFLLLALIFMTVALLAAPRSADAALVIGCEPTPVPVITSPRVETIVLAPRYPTIRPRVHRPVGRVVVAHRAGPRTIVRCGTRAAFVQRVWVPGHWEQTGPRMSRWVPGRWRRA